MQLWRLFLVFLVLSFSYQSAYAAELIANINPNNPESNIQLTYQRTIFIEYEQGGQIAEALKGKSGEVKIIRDSSTPEVFDLMNKINQKITKDGSGARLTNLNVEYSAELIGGELVTTIDYKIILSGTLAGYTIREGDEQTPTLIDMGWRGITVEGPVVINGFEINMPISFLREKQPTVYSLVTKTDAEVLLSENLINAEGIKNQSLSHWHFLFDPTGINVDNSQFGLDEEISGFVVSGYTLGDNLKGEMQIETAVANFTIDRDYNVRSVEPADNAHLAFLGFGALDKLDELEIIGVTPKPLEGYATTSTGEFPVGIFYGLGWAVIISGIVIIPIIIGILWKKGIIFT